LSDLDLSIIIPAFNDAHKFGADVEAADRFLEQESLRGEIILVNDGSSDDTIERARLLQERLPRLRLVSYAENRGKGCAIAQGVKTAQGRLIMFADAGMCVPYEIARLALTMLELDLCDIAIGSRRARGSVKKAQPLYRRIGARGHKILVHILGVPSYISDTQCGFKFYRAEVAKRLFAELITDGFMFDVEIILRAIRDGCRILEFPSCGPTIPTRVSIRRPVRSGCCETWSESVGRFGPAKAPRASPVCRTRSKHKALRERSWRRRRLPAFPSTGFDRRSRA
jgi:dolichyl-phosphate beta-glucosyltransferase